MPCGQCGPPWFDSWSACSFRPARRAGRGEDAFRLGRGERDPLAEHVDRLGQPLRGDQGIISLRGNRRTRTCRRTPAGSRARRGRWRTSPPGAGPALAARSSRTSVSSRSSPYPDLISTVVTPSASRASSRGRPAEQVGLARRTGRADGGEDAAAGGGDLLVGRPGEPHLELVRPVAGVDEVRVAVDQPGLTQRPSSPISWTASVAPIRPPSLTNGVRGTSGRARPWRPA